VQQGWQYKGSFYAKSTSYRGPITVSLKSTSGTTYATATLSSPTLSSNYQKYSFTFSPSSSAPDAKNVFVVELDGASAKGTTVYFGLFSLFPPTYKNRPNGMRIDLAEAMAGTKPSVWRFPGGNNLEGSAFNNRWKWNETIGP
jgi:alpha-L-arabinofuranosidase